MQKFLICFLFISPVICNEDPFQVKDIKVKCNCNNKSWKTEKIDPNWTAKLKLFPPKNIRNKVSEESGALGETRTPTS